jgi:hypothetical protein
MVSLWKPGKLKIKGLLEKFLKCLNFILEIFILMYSPRLILLLSFVSRSLFSSSVKVISSSCVAFMSVSSSALSGSKP